VENFGPVSLDKEGRMDVAEPFLTAMEMDQPFVAERALESLHHLAKTSKAAQEALHTHNDLIASHKQDISSLKRLLHEIRSNDGWSRSINRKKERTTVHFKKPSGSKFLMTKTAAEVSPYPGCESASDLFVALVSMFAETDLMKHCKFFTVDDFERKTRKSNLALKFYFPVDFPRNLVHSHDTIAINGACKFQLSPFERELFQTS